MINESLTKAWHSASFLHQELREAYPDVANPAEDAAILAMIGQAAQMKEMLLRLVNFHEKVGP